MQRQYGPSSSVGLLGGFPENSYPASAFYGVDSTLGIMNQASASSEAIGGNGNSLLPGQVEAPNMRTIVVAFLTVLGAVALWHFYMK